MVPGDQRQVARGLPHRLLAVALVAFVLLVFVGLEPLADRVGRLDLDETGEGSLARQILYVSLALAFGWSVYRYRLLGMAKLPLPVVAALGWCAVTLFWSPVPGIGLRRLGLTVLVVMTTYSSVALLGAKRSIELLALTLIGCVLVSLLAGLFIPNAVHQPGEEDAALIGAWRGVFPHKNPAGVAAALCVIIGYFFWNVRVFGYGLRRRPVMVMAVAAGASLLVLSLSKTAMVLVIPTIAMGVLFRKLSGIRSGRLLLVMALVFASCLLLAGMLAINDIVAEVVSDPKAFTGRGAIWLALAGIIAANPFGGVGFGSIFQVGLDTPLLHYAPDWVLTLSAGHNGYLEVIASTGFIGFILALFAFIIRPFFQVIRSRGLDPRLGGMLIAIITFVALHNLLESSLLNRDRGLWVVLVLVGAITQTISRKKVTSGGRGIV
jgi:exopolysaccharide production protein ExoQ